MKNRVLSEKEEKEYKALKEYYDDMEKLYAGYVEDEADMMYLNDVSSLLRKVRLQLEID